MISGMIVRFGGLDRRQHLMVYLETPRLIIRDYTLSEVANHHRLTQEAFDTAATLAQSQTWMEWAVRNYQALANLHQPPYGDYAIVLKASGALIGSVGLVPTVIAWGAFKMPPEDGRVSPEFGLFWAILGDQRGKGYAPEAARAMLDFVFGTLRAQRIVATTEHDNHNSIRVMQKLGMTIQHNPNPEPFWLQVVGVLEYTAYHPPQL